MPRKPSAFPQEQPIIRDGRDSRSEREFLLKLLGHCDPPSAIQLRSEASQIDWALLFAIVPPDVHGYLGYRLTELALQGHCPPALWKQTLNHRRVTTAEWLRFGLELRRLAHSFSAHNIDFLVLKGPVLAFTAYPDRSLRSMADLDILVRPEDMEKALDLTYAAGFICPDRHQFALPRVFFSHLQFIPDRLEISLPLQKPGTRSLIEIHTQLHSTEPWFPFNPCRVWENAEEVFLGGLPVKTLEKHEFLFHLVLHLARYHIFDRGLRPLLDVHLWLELHRDSLDWDHIVAKTIDRGYSDWMYLTLKIASNILQSPIPETFFMRVPAPPQFETLQQLAYEQIWGERRTDRSVPSFLGPLLAQPSARKAASLLFKRVSFDRGKVDAPLVPPLDTLRRGGLLLSIRRAVVMLRTKIPRYFRAWYNGNLGWSSLRHAARLAKGRTQIQEILVNRVRV